MQGERWVRLRRVLGRWKPQPRARSQSACVERVPLPLKRLDVSIPGTHSSSPLLAQDPANSNPRKSGPKKPSVASLKRQGEFCFEEVHIKIHPSLHQGSGSRDRFPGATLPHLLMRIVVFVVSSPTSDCTRQCAWATCWEAWV